MKINIEKLAVDAVCKSSALQVRISFISILGISFSSPTTLFLFYHPLPPLYTNAVFVRLKYFLFDIVFLQNNLLNSKLRVQNCT